MSACSSLYRRHCPVRSLEHRGHARHRLETADSPAAAALGATALRHGPEDRMADLARARAIALEQLALEDDSGTDAAADADDDQVVRPRDAAERALGDSRGLRVVGDDHGHAEALRDHARPAAGRSSRD